MDSLQIYKLYLTPISTDTDSIKRDIENDEKLKRIGTKVELIPIPDQTQYEVTVTMIPEYVGGMMYSSLCAYFGEKIEEGIWFKNPDSTE